MLRTELDLPFDDDISPGATPPANPRPYTGLRSHENGHELYDLKRDSPREIAHAARETSVDQASTEPFSEVRRTPIPPALPAHLTSPTGTSSHAQSPDIGSSIHDVLQRQDRPSGALPAAVDGLESLMREALTMAKNAADSGHSEEAMQILDKAILALKNAGSVRDEMRDPMAQDARYSDDDTNSTHASTVMHDKPSADTLPTTFTRSTESSMRPDRSGDTGKRHDRTYASRSSSTEDIASQDIPRLHQPPSADSMVQDFAYLRGEKRKMPPPKVSSERISGKATTHYDDHDEFVATQAGRRKSEAVVHKPLPPLPKEVLLPEGVKRHRKRRAGPRERDGFSYSSSESLDFVKPRHMKIRDLSRADKPHPDRLHQLDPTPTNAMPMPRPERQTTFATALPDTEDDTTHHRDQNRFNDKVYYTTKVMSPEDKLDFGPDENPPSLISEHPVSKSHRYDNTRVRSSLSECS
jgi:hypothetical protein